MPVRAGADRVRGWVARWWRGEAGVAGAVAHAALAPAEMLFRVGTSLRNAGYDRGWLRSTRAPIPVVSVGNIGVGGAGKTPVSAWITGWLLERGARPAVVLRGYGADELLVHRELNPDVPIFAAESRVAGVDAAAAAGCDVAVLDDAFQHRALVRDLDLVLVAAETWGPPRHLLPRGPWREDPGALRRADLVLVTRKSASPEEARAVAAELRRLLPGTPCATCDLEPTGIIAAGGGALPLDWLRGRTVLAVASLADPAPFIRQLRGLGAEVEARTFPDHHDFSFAEARDLVRLAGDRPLVCTRKEAVKLRPLLGPRAPLHVLDQRVVPGEGAAELERRLLETLARRAALPAGGPR